MPYAFPTFALFARCTPIGLAAIVLAVAGAGSVRAEEASAAADASDATDGSADASEASPEVDPLAPTPPKLIEAEEPVAPEGVPLPGEVVVVLTVDKDGSVSDATVRESSDARLETAALAAALASRFEPARSGGEPRAARIAYRVDFPAPPPPAEGELSLRLVDDDGAPLVGLELTVTSRSAAQSPGAEEDDLARQTSAAAVDLNVLTDEQGQAYLKALAPGRYQVTFTDLTGEVRSYTEVVSDGEITEARYRLALPETPELKAEARFEATAEVEAPPREVTRRTLEARELNRIAGTRGDAVRGIEVLPGVGRPPFLSGDIIIRGASPQDSEIFLDGSPVPRLYHFGGFVSVFPSPFVGQVDFYPGNFSVRYGRRVGGVVEVTPSALEPERTGGYLDASLFDASFMFEGPIAENVDVSAAARRSYVDAVFEALVPDGAISTTAAPVYWDYQTRARWTPSSRDEVTFLAYGSSDRLRLLFSEASDQDPSFRGNLRFETQFHRGEVRWRHRLNARTSHKLLLAGGTDNLRLGLGPALNFDLNTVPLAGRSEWVTQVHPRLTLNSGIDIQATPFSISYAGSPNQAGEGNPFGTPLSAQDRVEAQESGFIVSPAVYVEALYQATDALALIGGVRADYFGQIKRAAVDPRFVARYAFAPTWLIKGGVGLFSQPPQPQEAAASVDGNPELRPTRSIHVSTGLEKQISPDLRVGVEGFYKQLFDRVVGAPPGESPSFTNDGIGRIYGAELDVRLLPSSGRYYGLLSYTLMRSERNDRGEGWRPFDFDQSHIFNVAGGYRFKNNIEIGGRFLYVAGNPTTPVLGSLFDSASGLYLPIFGPVNSARNPAFHRLDVRLAKVWYLDRQVVTLYLDVQNAYNRRNQEDVSYNFDFSESEPLAGLPILPSIGARVAF